MDLTVQLPEISGQLRACIKDITISDVVARQVLNVERLCDIFFELSNEDRLEILFKLQEDHMKVTTLSQKLEITSQECSRHLARLSEAKLVEKDPEGFFNLTQFGWASLKLIPSWNFISEHSDYFNVHSLEKIPSELASRIGELRKSEPTENVMVTFHVVESLIKNAEEYIWLMHDQYILNTLPLLRERLENGVTFRTFEPQAKEPQRDLDPMRHHYIAEDDEYFFMKVWESGQVSTKFSDDIEVFLYISEKEAFIAFPLSDGSFDYIGFYSKEPSMRRFCRDLFDSCWEKGVPLTRERGMRVLERRKKFYQESTTNE
jgi:predicted transcriptional regulator